MRIGLDISPLFNTKGVTGIPRVCMKLAQYAPVKLHYIAGDRLVPQHIGDAVLERPGASDAVRKWANGDRYELVDSARLDQAIFTLWRVPRRVAKFETTTLMDFTPISHPQYHRETGMAVLFDKHVLKPMAYNDRLVCISHATRDALVSWDGRFAPRAVVAHLGHDWYFNAPMEPTTPRRFLCVGSVEPRKNLKLVVRWFLRSPSVCDSDRLLVIGGDGWGVDWQKLLDSEAQGAEFFARAAQIERTGFVTDERLSSEYRRAFCLIYPSHFEGFGLPPLEAMAHGCPVIMSDRGSLPEVGGDCALYVRDVEAWIEIESCFRQLVERRSALACRAMKHAAKFTWEAFAESVFVNPG